MQQKLLFFLLNYLLPQKKLIQYVSNKLKYMENKELIIELTDARIHADLPRKPKPWYAVFLNILRTSKPDRIYTKDVSADKEKMVIKACFPLPPDLAREVDEARKNNREIKVVLPEEGIPLYASRDTTKYIKKQSGGK